MYGGRRTSMSQAAVGKIHSNFGSQLQSNPSTNILCLSSDDSELSIDEISECDEEIPELIPKFVLVICD